MLTEDQVHVAAERLYKAEKGREQIPALTLDYPEMSMDDATVFRAVGWSEKSVKGLK